jgi:NADPH:quinone reductase-like Zn-dependent oxidoreductase
VDCLHTITYPSKLKRCPIDFKGMISILFNQGIIPADVVERPIEEDFVSITPQRVLLSAIENSIFVGFLWIRPWTIIGSIGIGKVDEVGLSVDEGLKGKTVLVLPYSPKYGGIGTEINGLLVEKTNMPSDSIVTLPENPPDKLLLYPFASVALQIKEYAEGKEVLILGSGLTAMLTYLALKDSATLGIYSDEDVKLPYAQKIKKSDKKWDMVVVSTMRGWARVVADSLVKDNGKIVIPKFLNSWPAIVPKNPLFVPPVPRDDVIPFLNREVTDKLFEENVGYADDVISAIPTPKNGVIVDVKKALKKAVELYSLSS